MRPIAALFHSVLSEAQRPLLQTAAARRAVGATQEPAAPDAVDPPLEFEVPLGESGTGTVQPAPAEQALLRLYAFERQHAAAQAANLRRAGIQDARIEIRIKTGVDTKGRAVPVAGVTEARADTNNNGAPELLWRELAAMSTGRQLLLAGGAKLFGMPARPMPTLRQSGTAGAALRVMKNRGALREEFERPGFLALARQLNPRQNAAVLAAFAPVEQALGALDQSLKTLLGAAALAGVQVQTSGTGVEAEVTGVEAGPGRHEVAVRNLATAHTVASDPLPLRFVNRYAPGSEELGLRGAFELNHEPVSVQEDDSLQDLVTRINHGEDTNRDGRLAAAEDRNSNERLDGGTSRHGVVARAVNRRLLLSQVKTGNQPLAVRDPDGVLAALGVVREVPGEGPVFQHPVETPAAAVFTVNGQSHRADTNAVSGVIAGLRLHLKAPTQAPVTVHVAPDPSGLARSLTGFVTDFNQAMTALNDALRFPEGPLAREEPATRTRTKLGRLVHGPVELLDGQQRTGAEVGLQPTASPTITLAAPQLDVALAQVKTGLADGLASLRQQTSIPAVTNALGRLGITSREDSTLSLDTDRLAAALAEDFAGTRGLLIQPKGYLHRLAQTVQEAIDPQHGLLPAGRRIIEATRSPKAGEALEAGVLSAQQLALTRLLGDLAGALPLVRLSATA